MIKSKLGGRSNASFENIREERFWELLGNKNVELESNASSPHQMEVLSSFSVAKTTSHINLVRKRPFPTQ